MKKVTVRDDKTKKFKPFDVELKDVTMDEREEINNLIFDTQNEKNFTWFLKIIQLGTNYTRDDLNYFSNDELFALSGVVIENVNKKKLKK